MRGRIVWLNLGSVNYRDGESVGTGQAVADVESLVGIDNALD
jgi:hypothetical protein